MDQKYYYYYLAQARFFTKVKRRNEIFHDDIKYVMRTQLYSDEFIEMFISSGNSLKYFPEKLLTQELCDLHFRNSIEVEYIPTNFRGDDDDKRYFEINNDFVRHLRISEIKNNKEAIKYITEKRPELFKKLPKKFITDDIITRAIKKHNHLLNDFTDKIPHRVLNGELFKSLSSLKFVHDDYMTEDIINYFIHQDIRNLKYVNEANKWNKKHENILINAVKKGHGDIVRFINEKIKEAKIDMLSPYKKFQYADTSHGTIDIIWDIIEGNIPITKEVNYEIIKIIIDIKPEFLAILDKSLVTDELINIANNSEHFHIYNIPDEYVQLEKCVKYFRKGNNQKEIGIDKLPMKILTDVKFLAVLDFDRLDEIQAEIINEDICLRLIDEIDENYELLNYKDSDRLIITDRVIEKTLKKFPSMIVHLDIGRLGKDGKKWYDLAVATDINKKITDLRIISLKEYNHVYDVTINCN